MDKKYFTSKFYVVFNIVLVVVSILIAYMLRPSKIGLILLCGFILMNLLCYKSWCYPEITEDSFIQKNLWYWFYVKRYYLVSIEKILVHPYGRFAPYVVVCSEGKRRIHSLCCMSIRSIKPFVEELRSKGVAVECMPYTLDGHTVYL